MKRDIEDNELQHKVSVITKLQHTIAVEEPEIFLQTKIFGLWVEKLKSTISRQISFKMTFERLV